jgi:hypothetical protein
LEDIERELKYYKHHFKDKVIYCNCDDPRVSNFFHYFSYNFKKLGLKKLITTCYKSINPDLFSQNDSERAIYIEYEGSENENGVPNIDEIGIVYLERNGDFRSRESIELLKQADIVVTNPPFSLFREYVAQLMEYDKKFVIIGNVNAISYKECFEYIRQNKIWLGYNCVRHFGQPDGTLFETARTYWYTNLDITKRHEDIILYKPYNEIEYPRYDNYDAIEVSKASDIPMDYPGVMGVPITFLDKYNPEQFDIIGITKKVGFHLRTKIYPNQIQVDPNGARTTVSKLNDGATLKVAKPPTNKTYYIVNGEYFVQLYARVLIRSKKL